MKTLVFIAGMIVLALVIVQSGHDQPTLPAVDQTAPSNPKISDDRLSEWFWPAYRQNQSLTASVARVPNAEMEMVWQYESGSAIKGGAVVASGTAWLANRKGSYFALDLKSGKPLWQNCLCHPIESTGLLVNDNGRYQLFFGSDRGKLLALDANSGELLYTFSTQGSIVGGASSFVDAGAARVVFGSHDCFLYCLDAKSGNLLFKYETDNFVNGTPAQQGETIILGGCDGFLRGIDSKSGSATKELDLGSYIPSSPAISDNIAYLALHDNAVVAVDLAANKIKWKFEPEPRSEFFAPPAVNQDCVVAASSDGRIFIIERNNGNLRHKLSVSGKLESEPVVDQEKMVIADLDGFIYFFDLRKGDLIRKFGHGTGISAPLTVEAAHLLVADLEGRVTLYRETPRKDEADD